MDKDARRELRAIKGGEAFASRRTGGVEGSSQQLLRQGMQTSVTGSEGFDRSQSLDEAEAGVAPRSALDDAAPQAGDTHGGPRSGSALWSIARQRALRRRIEQGSAASDLRAPLMPGDNKRMAIDKLLFRLARTPSRHADQQGEAQRGPEAPSGAFAPAHDARHLWSMLLSSYLNVLLLAVPTGLAAGALSASPTLVFVANFTALIPLALILGEITEDLAIRFGDAVGGLLNATFGNVVEMILGLAALSRGLYQVVAASLIGSILSNLLLVLGCCFLFGGLTHKEQSFNSMANKVASSLLFMASISIIIPTTAKVLYSPDVVTEAVLTNLSHVIALLLIGMYICYLWFQLKTHADVMGGESADAATNGGVADTGGGGGDADVPKPSLSLSGALFSLALITVVVAACSEYLTGAIEAVSKSSGVNQAFLGLIVLPIAGNAAEHITAVFVAVKDKMDLAISVSLGSSIQIALFVLPVTVLAGWVMGRDLTLDFDPFAVLMLTVSVILAYFVSSDGSSNWLLGLQLVLTYVLIGMVYLLENERESPDGPGAGPGAAAAGGAGLLLSGRGPLRL